MKLRAIMSALIIFLSAIFLSSAVFSRELTLSELVKEKFLNAQRTVGGLSLQVFSATQGSGPVTSSAGSVSPQEFVTFWMGKNEGKVRVMIPAVLCKFSRSDLRDSTILFVLDENLLKKNSTTIIEARVTEAQIVESLVETGIILQAVITLNEEDRKAIRFK